MGQVALGGDELLVIDGKQKEAGWGFANNAVSTISIVPGIWKKKKKKEELINTLMMRKLNWGRNM